MSYLLPPPDPAPVVVSKDVGGYVSEYRSRTEQFRQENREVRLHECRSACTLALSLPNVCVYPTSLLKFHQAYNADTKEVDLGITDELWRSYPQPVRARLGTLTRQYKVIKGDELIAMGLRDCNAPQEKIMIARARQAPQPQKESGTLLAGLGDTLGALISPTTPTVVQTRPVSEPVTRSPVEVAKPVPEPPPRPTEDLPALETTIDVPLPPPRPPMLARSEVTLPAFRRPMTGSQRILQPVFVSLASLR